jgi:VanZ family protein
LCARDLLYMNRKTTISFFYWQIPWILYCMIIFYLSADSSPPDVVSFPYSDKIKHAFLYLFLSLLTFLGFGKWPGGISRRYYFFWALIFCILYAASDEWHQSFVAGRSADVMDWVADVVGISIGGVIYRRNCKKRRKMNDS